MANDAPAIIHLPNGSYIDLNLPTRAQIKAFRDEQNRCYLIGNPKIAAKLKAKQ